MPCAASNKFSRYCRHEEYDGYALVTMASTRRCPSRSIAREFGIKIGVPVPVPPVERQLYATAA